MPRPRKRRRVCEVPKVKDFGPIEDIENNYSEIDKENIVIMSIEEYEIIRLMDYLGLNQEQSAELMGVARSTIQRIYEEARKKIADSLVNGKRIRIEGGNYRLCEENGSKGFCGGCNGRGKGRYGRQGYNNNQMNQASEETEKTEVDNQ